MRVSCRRLHALSGEVIPLTIGRLTISDCADHSLAAEVQAKELLDTSPGVEIYLACGNRYTAVHEVEANAITLICKGIYAIPARHIAVADQQLVGSDIIGCFGCWRQSIRGTFINIGVEDNGSIGRYLC